MNLLSFLIVGLIAGWLAGLLTKGEGFGWIGNLVVGIIGAILGGFLFELVGFETRRLPASIITATVGALIFLWLANKFGKGKLKF